RSRPIDFASYGRIRAFHRDIPPRQRSPRTPDGSHAPAQPRIPSLRPSPARAAGWRPVAPKPSFPPRLRAARRALIATTPNNVGLAHYVDVATVAADAKPHIFHAVEDERFNAHHNALPIAGAGTLVVTVALTPAHSGAPWSDSAASRRWITNRTSSSWMTSHGTGNCRSGHGTGNTDSALSLVSPRRMSFSLRSCLCATDS